MLRSTFVRVAPYLAFLVPVMAACGTVSHEVGSDDAGSAADGATSQCTTRAGIVCNTPDVPEGCTLSASTCANDEIHCGQVICPSTSDAGDCASQAAVCNPPDLSPGCTLGANTCVGGEVRCGAVTCIDGDAGADAGSCDGQTAPPCAPPPTGCSYVGPTCVAGQLTCGTLECSDAGVVDAAIPIACGSTTCNAATEYCDVTPACIATPDGGSSASSTCTPIPSSCSGSADICQCILNGVLSQDGPGSASVVKDGAACSLTENCV
jgi:hypothetical protein